MVIVRRVKPLPYWIVPILALVIGILISIVILYIMTGASPIDVLASLAFGFTRPAILAKTFIILTIVGTALLVSFKGAIWNIGGEGQITMGILAAAWIALFTPIPYATGTAMDALMAKILMFIMAMVAGAFWAFLSALPKAFLKLDEVAVTLIMNYIAYYIADILVYGPWKGKHTYSYIRTDTLPENTWLIRLPGTNATIEGVIVLILLFVAAWILLNKTSIGLRIRVLGNNPNLLRSSGISVPLMVIIALTISGAIAGIVGVLYLAGDVYNIGYPIEQHTAGYGYTGILVAWLSMLQLWAIPLASFIVSALYSSGIQIQVIGAGSGAVVNVFIGAILLTYTIVIVSSEYKIKFIVKKSSGPSKR